MPFELIKKTSSSSSAGEEKIKLHLLMMMRLWEIFQQAQGCEFLN